MTKLEIKNFEMDKKIKNLGKYNYIIIYIIYIIII